MKHVVIVGGGITGLITALKLYKDYKITVIDAGPDPRAKEHTLGATYSGLDARHISFTETAPWTSKSRHDLIVTASKDNGWLCIPKEKLNSIEQQWISEFQKTALDSEVHGQNIIDVIELNKKGIDGWEELSNEYDFIKPVTDHHVMPIICRSKTDLLDEFSAEKSFDKRCKLYENETLPDSLLALAANQKELGNLGYFTLYGNAYYAKTLCYSLINFLESQGVDFLWNKHVADAMLFESKDHFPYSVDAVAWCSGVSHHAAEILSGFNMLLCGVMGCWIEIDNPGITVPCKIYGPEPVNYINITPKGNKLLMSGGYGFVGTRTHGEAIELGKPIMDAMIEEVKKWFPKSPIKNQAYCIRPATPTGVPSVTIDKLNKKFPIVVTVGHSAGGFTQAPNTAETIKEKLLTVI